MSSQKVIFDTDPGIDDCWALIALLKSEERFNIELKAVTVVTGNTTVKNGCQNALLVLKTLNRLDVKVYAGCDNSIIPKEVYLSPFHGNDGLNDRIPADEKPGLDLVQNKHAIEAMKELIEEFPNEITICAVGPLTNIALLYKLYPKISEKIKAVYAMGGNLMGVGNVTRCAEFNFWFDPEAARIILDETKCPLYLLPWEICLKSMEVTPYPEWRLNILNKVNSKIIHLMDRVEKDPILKDFVLCDAYLAGCFMFPKMIKKMRYFSATVELSGEFARGLMVLDHEEHTPPNAYVIQEIDYKFFENVVMWAVGHDVNGF